ncbi:uncharacterized protein LOC115237990 isoform X1 [Formica exsecta]|uniref:uncharacterized protein LOC115237990 isoform X1 n=1 Tax=Formica exsecta TaxID=72781 RepID=UPI0011427D84|nr:uncharacterized protein LOC115237990 isoform X1 [Formica exsecta]XP_029667308.1 uncharacterized protein LOC115237990 isoform X1 [Formica exsecta]
MLRIVIILSFICWLDSLSAHPADEPTKFILNDMQNNAESILPSRLEEAKQLTSETQNNVEPVVIMVEKPNQSRRSVQSTTPIVLFHPMTRESVRLENETEQAILERRKPDNIRQALNNIVTPTPIVDGIKEEEKYGNTGDTFIGFGRVFVKGFENLANTLSAIINIPYNAAKQTSRAATQILDQLGKRLIGLE